MSIVVEEEKKASWATAIMVIVMLLIVFVGGYYLFFKNPELIEVVAPDKLKRLSALSEAKFDPNAVIDSSAFKALRDFTSPLVLPQAGRAEPFQPK